MSDHIKIQAASGTWVVRAAGAVLGESNDALALNEDGYPEVIYFPRKDISMAFFDKSSKSTHCPYKGDATYYDLEAKSGTFSNAAWSYEAPIEGMSQIAGYLAFDPTKVAVEQV